MKGHCKHSKVGYLGFVIKYSGGKGEKDTTGRIRPVLKDQKASCHISMWISYSKERNKLKSPEY